MGYTKQNWENLPSTNTPITAERLNHMEDGIEEAWEHGGGGAGETLPVGSEIDFDGQASEIPTGWEQIADTSKILWTNSNPNNDFAAQTITLNSADYDVLEWIYRSDVSGNLCFSEKSIKGYGTQFVMPSLSSGSKQWVRRIIRTSDTQFSAYDGRSLDGGTATNANSFCVPLYVIGYKTGLF